MCTTGTQTENSKEHNFDGSIRPWTTPNDKQDPKLILTPSQFGKSVSASTAIYQQIQTSTLIQCVYTLNTDAEARKKGAETRKKDAEHRNTRFW